MENEIYILTEDLSFFFRLNQYLKRLNINFKVLNIGGKIPPFPSLILTTSEEAKNKYKSNEKYQFIPYDQEEDFERYIIKILAAYRIGIKEFYSKILFSVDPGTKYIGLGIFLDSYYINSYTFYNNNDLIKKVNEYILSFQKINSELLKLTFKFGRGILSLTKNLVEMIFDEFNDQRDIEVYLIDETKSSKFKIHNKYKKIPKDEVSALILALRDGVKVTKENISQIFNHIKKIKHENDIYKNVISERDGYFINLREILLKILDGELSLSNARKMLEDNYSFKK